MDPLSLTLKHDEFENWPIAGERIHYYNDNDMLLID